MTDPGLELQGPPLATIMTKFAQLDVFTGGCVTRFPTLEPVAATPHPHMRNYRRIAARCGYATEWWVDHAAPDTWGAPCLAYCVEHELAHLLVEEVLHDRPSRVLWALALGHPLTGHRAAYEEGMAQMLQRWVRAGEEPIIGGVDWVALRDRFLELTGG